MTRPFADLRVLDFTTTVAGPYCARLLADAGADVIKIETLEGELTRHRPPLRNGSSTSFGQLNAGKRSLALNLKQAEAVAIVRRLISDTDVLVENFRPGVMARFGLDYAALSEINPKLIYCAISGYGQTGPSSTLAAYAPAIHAASGYDMAHLVYQEGRERPDNCGIYTADILSGSYAYGAIATALVQRHTSGRGQMIDVSMLEAMLNLTISEVQLAQFPQPPAGKPLFGPVATANGYIMPAIASERTFQNLARAAGREDWLTDPRFAEYPTRRENWGELIAELELWSTQRTTAECEAALNRHGVPCSAYRSVAEAMADPQIAHRQAMAEVVDAGGSFRVMNAPYRMSEAVTSVRDFSAGLGQHTVEVLRGAGFADAEIERLVASGAILAA